MIYLDLFIGFLQVGLFAFGGAYGAIPLIRDIVLSYGWMSDIELSYIIAVSESTPGPIMVNLATYVGSIQGGLPGAVLATAAVVLPSFLIITMPLCIRKNGTIMIAINVSQAVTSITSLACSPETFITKEISDSSARNRRSQLRYLLLSLLKE